MENADALPTRDSLVSPIGKRKRGDKEPSPAKSASVSTSIDSAPSQAHIPKGARGQALLNVAGGKSSQPSGKGTPSQAPTQAATVSDPTPTKKVKLPPNPLLKQTLPKHLATLRDMFNALHQVYGIMKKRGLRTTYQAMQFPVQEACGKRFTTTHLAQLQTLLPHTLSLEWIRIAPNPQSTRVEPALLITLRPQPPATDIMSLRDEVHCALARHLLTSYASFLEEDQNNHGGADENNIKEKKSTTTKAKQVVEKKEQVKEKDSTEEQEAPSVVVEPTNSDAATPPELPLTVVTHFQQPYPDAAPEISPTPLPVNHHLVASIKTSGNSVASGGNAGSAGGSGSVRSGISPLVLGGKGNAASGGRHHLTTLSCATTTTTITTTTTSGGGNKGDTLSIQNSQAGRPPLPPGLVRRGRLQQRRLSFSVAGGARPPAFHSPPPLPPSDGTTTTEDVNNNNNNIGCGDDETKKKVYGMDGIIATTSTSMANEALDESQVAHLAKDNSRLLASMPEELRRRSMDGIISMDTLKALEANELEHTALSSDAALAARQRNAALGALPKMFGRLQRIFGSKGPTAMRLNDIVMKIKQGGAETTSEVEIQNQLKALAEHAPEYLTLKPWGSCGTPAVWINRKCNGKEIVGKLKKVADGRLQR